MNNQFINRIDNISIIQNISYLRSHDTARQTQDIEVINGQDTKTMTLARGHRNHSTARQKGTEVMTQVVWYRRTQVSWHWPSVTEGHRCHDTGRQTPKDRSNDTSHQTQKSWHWPLYTERLKSNYTALQTQMNTEVMLVQSSDTEVMLVQSSDTEIMPFVVRHRRHAAGHQTQKSGHLLFNGSIERSLCLLGLQSLW